MDESEASLEEVDVVAVAPARAAELDDTNAPFLFPGLVADWPALRLWQGPSGLQRLLSLAGGAPVQVMLSSGTPNSFIGDMEHLSLLETTLGAFLDGSLEQELLSARGAAPGDAAAAAPGLYLAQSPISATAPGAEGLLPGPLHALTADFRAPSLLEGTPLSQVNLWASRAATRSSLHYDPYHNLLCLAHGAKTVRLLPPSDLLCPRLEEALRPHPAYHDSANHAAGDLWDERGGGARLRGLREYRLRPGDALFVPEGWWHQVESGAGTLAVNFWWDSPTSRRFGGASDAYYLRRLAQSLAERQRQRMLDDELAAAPHEALNEAGRRHAERHGLGGDPRPGHYLDLGGGVAAVERRMEPAEAAALAALLEAMEADAGEGGHVRLIPVAGPLGAGDGLAPGAAQVQQRVEGTLFALAARSWESLARVLLALAERRAEAAPWLLLRALGPPGWELLTTGLGERYQAELAAQGVPRADELLALLYDRLYSGVPDRRELTGAMLRCKQARGRQAMQAAVTTALQFE